MCGPFCSVPPIGTRIVVLPDFTRSRSSVQVSSSRNTESAVWPRAAAAADNSKHARSKTLRLNAFPRGTGVTQGMGLLLFLQEITSRRNLIPQGNPGLLRFLK